MLRDTVKNGFNGTKRLIKKTEPAGHAETYARTITHGRHTVMWLSGYKFTLRVDDWIGGH
jgi:hypothetical protein